MTYDTGYSFWVGVRKTLIQALIFGAPLLIQLLPATWMNLTLGGSISLLVNYLKFQYKASAPNQ